MSLIGVGGTESALAVYAHRLRGMITVKVIHYINIATGLVFIIVALKLLWDGFLK